ncbi:MAG: 2-hydroxychromene-2-carboxylate isomerase [Comamonadaceae bacterium]|nr:2-hydroxychromene-2-carboxylate isomerase [Comamonadaceae bacterium]
MHHIVMHLDFVSPYAWLAFQQLPQSLQGLNYHVEYRPVLLGALLHQHGNPGPAGIPAKRIWTYRHAEWLGQHMGIPLQMPAQHPFNPLPLLRLALQTSRDGSINRLVAETVFRHVWEGGADALDAERLQQLQAQLAEQLRSDDGAQEQAKQLLRNNTQTATGAQVFGVPAFETQGHIFWGVDSLPMLRDFLDGHAWFQTPAWENVKHIPSGLS